MVARTLNNRHTFPWIAAFLLAFLLAPSARAEDAFCDDCCDYDTRWFSPVDFDFNCRPLEKSCGYFFNYDKLSWYASGETVTIGKKGLVVPSEIIFGTSNPPGVSPFSMGTPPPTYDIINGIQDAQPDADFGQGDRYEFGRFNGNHGWLVGILDGPKVTTSAVYGFQEIILPNSLPLNERFLNPLNINWNPDISPVITPFWGTGSADLSTSRNGFGSVHVNFETPEGYLLGFRDYWTTASPDEDGSHVGAPVTGGPGRSLLVAQVTETIVTDINGNPQVQLQITGGTPVTGADGITDDLDGDRLPGFFFVVSVDADGNEVVIGNGIDFDDLHLFNIRFDNVYIKNVTESQGVEIMKTYQLDNSHLPVKGQSNRFSIAGGVRFLSLRDKFSFEGKGDLLGRTYADTRAYNQIVGPQLRAMWSKQFQSRWFMNLDGRFMFGYNIQNQKQNGAIGEDLIPGGLNSLASAQPTAFAYSRTKNSFSPTVELRAEGGYQLTSSIALKLGYTATYIDHITRASQTVRWYLPDMGILEGGNQSIFVNGVNFGIELATSAKGGQEPFVRSTLRAVPAKGS